MTAPTIHITWGPNVVLKTEPADPRWCFHCRKRLPGAHQLLDYAEPSYYDPIWVYRCDGCGGDYRLFPGWEWKDE